MSLSKGLTPDAVECEALNLHIADLILKTPDIKAENGDVKYTLTLTQQLSLISKIKLSPDISINSTVMSVVELSYLYNLGIQQNSYQRNLVSHAWSITEQKSYLHTLCYEKNVCFAMAMLFSNYPNLNDTEYNYISDPSCLFELPDFANRAKTMYDFATGKLNCYKLSFFEHLNLPDSILASQQIPVVIDIRYKTFIERQKNFLLLQKQKVVDTSSKFKNMPNAFNNYLLTRLNGMLNIEKLMSDIWDNCVVTGNKYWYPNTYRFIYVFKFFNKEQIDSILNFIIRDDKGINSASGRDDSLYHLTNYNNGYDTLLKTMDDFRTAINKSPLKYTYGSMPLFYYIFMKTCYDSSLNLQQEPLTKFINGISVYNTPSAWKNVWLGRKTSIPELTYKKSDVIEYLLYEYSLLIGLVTIGNDAPIPDIPNCYVREPISRETKYAVDDRDNREDGECKSCYNIVGEKNLVFGHIKPYCISRNNNSDNIVLICNACNSSCATNNLIEWQTENYPDKYGIETYMNEYI